MANSAAGVHGVGFRTTPPPLTSSTSENTIQLRSAARSR